MNKYKKTTILAILLYSFNAQASNFENLYRIVSATIANAQELEIIHPSENTGSTATQLRIVHKDDRISPQTLPLSADELERYIPVITPTMNKIAQDNLQAKRGKNGIPTNYRSRTNKHGHSITSPYYLCEYDTFEEFFAKAPASLKEEEEEEVAKIPNFLTTEDKNKQLKKLVTLLNVKK